MGCIFSCCFSTREDVEEQTGLTSEVTLKYVGNLCGRPIYRRPTNATFTCVAVICGIGALGIGVAGGLSLYDSLTSEPVITALAATVAVGGPLILGSIAAWSAIRGNFVAGGPKEDPNGYQMA